MNKSVINDTHVRNLNEIVADYHLVELDPPHYSFSKSDPQMRTEEKYKIANWNGDFVTSWAYETGEQAWTAIRNVTPPYDHNLSEIMAHIERMIPYGDWSLMRNSANNKEYTGLIIYNDQGFVGIEDNAPLALCVAVQKYIEYVKGKGWNLS